MTKDTEALREALKPFAAVAAYAKKMPVGAYLWSVNGGPAITRDHIVNALAALTTPASDAAPVALSPVIVRTGPCQHRWSHAPTVGYYLCVECGERHDHGTPIYEQLKDSFAHPPFAQSVDPVAGGEALREADLRAMFIEGVTWAMSGKPGRFDDAVKTAITNQALTALKGPGEADV